MRRVALRLALIMMVLAALGGYGCSSSSDPLDEVGQRYTKSIEFSDADEDGRLTIDVAQDECDDNASIVDNGGTPGDASDDIVAFDDLETYTGVVADITITVGEGAPGITLQGYTIEYIPQLSQTGTGMEMPPELESLTDQGSNNIDIPSNSSATFSITCMTIDTKEEYLIQAGYQFDTIGADEDSDGVIDYHIPFWTSTSALDEARYTIRINLFFEDTYGEDRTIVLERTVWLSNYDTCGS